MPPGEIEIAPFFQPPTIPDQSDAAYELEDYSLPIVCDDVSELLKAVMGDVKWMEEEEVMQEDNMQEDESEEKDHAMVEFLLTRKDEEDEEEEDRAEVQPVQDQDEVPADA